MSEPGASRDPTEPVRRVRVVVCLLGFAVLIGALVYQGVFPGGLIVVLPLGGGGAPPRIPGVGEIGAGVDRQRTRSAGRDHRDCSIRHRKDGDRIFDRSRRLALPPFCRCARPPCDGGCRDATWQEDQELRTLASRSGMLALRRRMLGPPP